MKPASAAARRPRGGARWHGLPWRSVLPRGLAFAALWWVLTEGDTRAWGLGVVTVLAALAASLVLWIPARQRVSAPALGVFIGFFLWHSVQGGLAVASLALRPRLRLRPSLHLWKLRLPPGRARVLLTDVMSLMPGTCSARLYGNTLLLHVLDESLVSEEDLRAAERSLARALRLELGLEQAPGQETGAGR